MAIEHTIYASPGLPVDGARRLLGIDGNGDLTLNGGGAGPLEVTPTGSSTPRTLANWIAALDAGAVNVRDPLYGARGDGSTDDSAALTLAFAAGGTVVIPPGTYIARNVNVPSDVVLIGAGEDTVFKHPAADLASGSSRILNVTGDNVLLQGFKCNGNKANITNGDINNVECIHVDGRSNVRVKQIHVIDAYSEGVDFDNCTDCYAQDIYGEDCGGMCVHISENCVRVYTVNSTAVGCGLASNRPGFDIYITATQCGITDCVSVGCHTGFNIHGSESAVQNITTYGSVTEYGVNVTGNGNVIRGVRAFDSAIAGVRIGGDGNDVSDVRVDGNVSGESLRIVGDKNKISGVRVVGGATTGILFVSGGDDNLVSDFFLDACGNTAVAIAGSRNKLQNGTINANVAGDAVNVTGDDCDVVNVTSLTSASDAFEAVGDRVTFLNCRSSSPVGAGFRTHANADATAFIGCRSTSPGTADLADAGTNTIVRSCGFTAGDERGGVATGSGNGSATAFTIAHGLGTTPTHASVEAGSAAAAGDFYVSALGSTNITVTYAAAPANGSSNLTWYWRAWVATRG